MRKIAIIFLLLSASCTETSTKETNEENQTDQTIEKIEISEELIMLDFQVLLDSANVDGSILVFSKNHFFSNDFDWAKKGHLPASTFKIPNSLIALESGVIENDSTMILWDGEPRFMKRWEKDLYFRDAFHTSCVPCYREIARNIGLEKMRQFTSDFHFGKMEIDSSNLDQFWLGGNSTISQFEQIDFLKQFHEKQLPVSERTQEIMSRMMIIEESDEYILRGKTGWSSQNDIDNCWFVGYIEAAGEVHYFATNIQLRENAEMSEIVSTRKEVTFQALKQLGIIEKD